LRECDFYCDVVSLRCVSVAIGAKGSDFIALTFGAEFLYFVGVVAAGTYVESKAGGEVRSLGRTLGLGLAIANKELIVQMLTGYPFVAGVLIFLAYRYLGVPAREMER
jgi:hypothetical protein